MGVLNAWLVHILTASGAVVGLFTFAAITNQNYQLAFLLMGISVVIDSVDGTLARRFNVAARVPRIDGSLLDNIVDYLNYAVVPAYFVVAYTPMMNPGWREMMGSAIVLASAYQFSQTDAKTDDHFFKGFPSYWNVVIFYLYIFGLESHWNILILALLIAMVFLPIKYLYPSRLTHFSRNIVIRRLILVATVLWGISMFILILGPQSYQSLAERLSLVYIAMYFVLSFYRSFKPLAPSHPK